MIFIDWLLIEAVSLHYEAESRDTASGKTGRPSERSDTNGTLVSGRSEEEGNQEPFMSELGEQGRDWQKIKEKHDAFSCQMQRNGV